MREKGRREGRPLIVAMSFRPVIPQRVARQQSPPPLHRLRTILRLRGAPCQSRAESLGVILGQTGWGKESKVKDTELYAALLGLGPPWRIREVRLDLAADRVDVWIEEAVARGWARKERRIPPYLCVDEKAFAKRHRYETVICDAERGAVEYVVEDRGQESLEAYYRQFTPQELAQVRAVAMDMWDPYVAATQAWVPGADAQIVFDNIH